MIDDVVYMTLHESRLTSLIAPPPADPLPCDAAVVSFALPSWPASDSIGSSSGGGGSINDSRPCLGSGRSGAKVQQNL
jgi:hypothetical protein